MSEETPSPPEKKPAGERLRLQRDSALVTPTTVGAEEAEEAPTPVPRAAPPENYAQALVLSGRQRGAVGAAMGFFLLASLLLGPRTLIPAGLAAAVFGLASLHLAARLRGYGLAPLFAAGLVYGGAVLLLGILLLGVAPAWQRSAVGYGGRLIGLVTELSQRVAEPAPEAGAPAARPDLAEEPGNGEQPRGAAALEPLVAQAREHTGRAGTAVVSALHQAMRATDPIRRLRVPLFFQASFLTAFLVAFPLLVGTGPPERAGSGLRLLFSLLLRVSAWLVSGVGSRIALRTCKALLVAVPVGAGIHYAGLEAAMFVAGCAFLLSFFCARGGSLGLLLALPLLPAAPRPSFALAVLVPLWLLLALGERRLHWRLVTWPALRAGLARAPQGTVFEAPRRRGAGALGWLRLAFNLLLLLAFGWVGYAVLPPYLAERERIGELDAARADLVVDRFEEARAGFEAVLERSPQEPRAWMGLMEVRAASGDPHGALEIAERLADGPPPVSEATWESRVRGRITAWALSYLSPGSKHPGRAAVYHALLRSLRDTGSDVVYTAADRLAELETGNPAAALALAQWHLEHNEPETAIERAHAGLSGTAHPDTEPDLYRVLAEAHMRRGEWAEALTASRRGLDIDPHDPLLQQARRTAEAHGLLEERERGRPETELRRLP